MWKELNDSHPAVLIVLKEAKSVREASDAVLMWYEKPASGGMTNADCPFLVRVMAKDLRIRKGNGTDTA